jgi:hypothetical protein
MQARTDHALNAGSGAPDLNIDITWERAIDLWEFDDGIVSELEALADFLDERDDAGVD